MPRDLATDRAQNECRSNHARGDRAAHTTTIRRTRRTWRRCTGWSSSPTRACWCTKTGAHYHYARLGRKHADRRAGLLGGPDTRRRAPAPHSHCTRASPRRRDRGGALSAPPSRRFIEVRHDLAHPRRDLLERRALHVDPAGREIRRRLSVRPPGSEGRSGVSSRVGSKTPRLRRSTPVNSGAACSSP